MSNHDLPRKSPPDTVAQPSREPASLVEDLPPPIDPSQNIELVDPEQAAARPLRGRLARAVSLISIAFTLWVLWTAGMGPPPNLINRAIFVIFGIILLFTLLPARKGRKGPHVPWYDWLFMLAGILAAVWVIFQYDRYITGLADPNTVDLILGAVLVIITIEGSRRVVGWEFTGVILVIMAYTLFGHLVPGRWGHPPLQLRSILETLYMSTHGLWGSITGVIATTISVYVIFGALLFHTGSGDTFIKLALFLTGRLVGGAAKVSAVSSALFGTISGSAAANVAVDGVITIPMMKRLGYGSALAGAVEATASTGGLIMPPIMGAAAFVMAEFVGVPYVEIVKAAILPAILYFLGLGAAVHFEALKRNLKPIPRAEIPTARDVFNWQFVRLVVPIALLIVLLLSGRSPAGVAFLPTLLVMGLYLVNVRSRQAFWERLKGLIRALDAAGRGLVLLVFLALGAQIIVALLGLTGIGTKFSDSVIGFSQQDLLLALLLTALVTTVLGMGVASVADYVLAASVIVPALVTIMLGMGYLEQDARFIAHLFIVYWASSSAITPPVGGAIFVAVGISRAKVIPTGLRASQLGIAAFIAPFIFVYAPALLGWGTIWEVILVFGTSAAGIIILAAGIAGYWMRRTTVIERLILLGAGVMLLWPDVRISAIGGVLAATVFVWQQFIRPAPREARPGAAEAIRVESA